MAKERLTSGRPATGESRGGDSTRSRRTRSRIAGFCTTDAWSSITNGPRKLFEYAARITAAIGAARQTRFTVPQDYTRSHACAARHVACPPEARARSLKPSSKEDA